MDMREAAQGAGGEARGVNAHFATVSSDTRTIAQGALFVALRGERCDGHEYLAAAHARGAVAAMAAGLLFAGTVAVQAADTGVPRQIVVQLRAGDSLPGVLSTHGLTLSRRLGPRQCNSR